MGAPRHVQELPGPALRCIGIARRGALWILLAVVVAGCDRGPSEAERKARDQAMAKLVQQARDEDREKDRRMREQARLEAERQMPKDTSPEPARTGDEPAPTTEPAMTAGPRQEQGAAPYLARLKSTLVDPESMQIRDLSLRENSSILCVEINARNRAGTYIGFTPVIVTADKVLFYPFASDIFDAKQPTAVPEFLIMNARVRCWAVEGAKK